MRKPIHFLFIAVLLYYCIYIALYPYLGSMLDPDAIGYLTVAKKYADGNFANAVNGYWSPLNIWLLVPFIKMGFNAFAVAKVYNFMFVASAFILFYQLMQVCKVSVYFQKIILLCLPVFMVYISYAQIFGDVLQMNFLLVYLLIITSKNFMGNMPKYIACAIVMALACYAKTYSYVFFMLHFMLLHVWHWYNTKEKYVLQMLGTFALCTILLLPWSMALQNKYKQFSLLGNVGKLNISWYLTSKKDYKDSIQLLIPPAQSGDATFWVDPYPSQNPTLHIPIESPKMFVKWIGRIGFTFIQFLNCLHEMSCLLLGVLLIGLYCFLYKKNKNTTMQYLLLTAICLPIGYLAVHIESRFIWLLLFIGSIVLAKTMEQYVPQHWQKKLTIIFCVSILLYPIIFIAKNINNGKENIELANAMVQNHIQGSCTSNCIEQYCLWTACYYTHNQFYSIEKQNYTQSELETEMKRYGVQYFIKYTENNMLDEQIKSAMVSYHKITTCQNYSIYQLTYK